MARKVTVAMCIRWIREKCEVDTGSGIYGSASKYTEAQIRNAISYIDAERGRTPSGKGK